MEQSQIRYLEKDLMRRFKSAGEIFEDADPEDKEFLHQFSFICLLSFDVYMKKTDHRKHDRPHEFLKRYGFLKKKTNNIRSSHPVINVRRRAHRKKNETDARSPVSFSLQHYPLSSRYGRKPYSASPPCSPLSFFIRANTIS